MLRSGLDGHKQIIEFTQQSPNYSKRFTFERTYRDCVSSLFHCLFLLEKESNEHLMVFFIFFVSSEGFCCFYYLKKSQRNGLLALSMVFQCQADVGLQPSTLLPFLFFIQPLLCCAVELEGPDATAALNTSQKCKSKGNATAVSPPLIVSGTLLSPGPVVCGLHPAILCTACYCSWVRQH